MRTEILSLAVLCLFSMNCGGITQGSIGKKGYSNKEFHYQVESGIDQQLMPAGWSLDNFYRPKPDPSELDPKPGELREKDGPGHVVILHLDVDGDGSADEEIERLIFDLRFEHENHDGVIFLRTIPVDGAEGRKRLSVLMDRYVAGVAGANYEVVTMTSASQVQEKRHAALMVSKGESAVASIDAFEATIDVANLDQIRLDPTAVERRIELVILRTPFSYIFRGGVFPVLMIAGYSNQVENFAEGLGDFHEFLGRIQISGKRGYKPRTAPERAANEHQ